MQHPLLVAPVVHTYCFEDAFKEHIFQLFDHVEPSDLVTAISPLALVRGLADPRDASAAKIQARVRGVLTRRVRTLDATPLARRRPPSILSPTSGARSSSPALRAHTPTAPTTAQPVLAALRWTTQAASPDLRPATGSPAERKSPLTLAPSRSLSAQSLRLAGSGGGSGGGSRAASPTTTAMTMMTDGSNDPTAGGGVTVFKSLAPDVQLSSEFDDSDIDRFSSSSSDSLASLSLIPTSPHSPTPPACLLAADARLAGYRRAAGRGQTLTGMSAAQLIEERKMLKKELQQARERHVLPSSPAAATAGPATAGPSLTASMSSGKTGLISGNAKASSSHIRSRSLSSPGGAPATAAGQRLACEHCTGDVDWKVSFQSMLVAYKHVNAALRAKGIVVDAQGTATSTMATPTGSRPGSAGGLQHVSSTPMLTSLQHLTAPNTAAAGATPVPNHRLGPLNPLASSAAGPAMPAATPSSTSSITVARARGVRKAPSASAPLVVASGSTHPSGVSSTTPLRVGSRSSSPSPATSTGSLPAANGATSNGFAQWSQQSQATMQAAHLPAFKPAAQPTSSFNPYGLAAGGVPLQTASKPSTATATLGSNSSVAPSQAAFSKLLGKSRKPSI